MQLGLSYRWKHGLYRGQMSWRNTGFWSPSAWVQPDGGEEKDGGKKEKEMHGGVTGGCWGHSHGGANQTARVSAG